MKKSTALRTMATLLLTVLSMCVIFYIVSPKRPTDDVGFQAPLPGAPLFEVQGRRHPSSNVNFAKPTLSYHVTTRPALMKVILLAYYRTGSTLAGEMFNSNPSAFYWFEPLAAVTQRWGWDRDVIPPRNFYHFDNGTEKQFTQEDVETLVQPLHDIFQCNFSSTSPQLFNHWFMTADFLENVSQSMIPFKTCMKNSAKPVDANRLARCLLHLYRRCRGSPLRVVKVIRLSMAVAGRLLDSDPSVRIMHLVRDPRGMLESWWRSTPMKAASRSTAEALLDAAVMCRRILTDCIVRRTLEARYPGRLQLIRYEDLAARPIDVLGDVYGRLLKQEIPVEVVRALNEMINSTGNDGPSGTRRTNSTATASRWRSTMQLHLVTGITARCLTLLQELGYDVMT